MVKQFPWGNSAVSGGVFILVALEALAQRESVGGELETGSFALPVSLGKLAHDRLSSHGVKGAKRRHA